MTGFGVVQCRAVDGRTETGVPPHPSSSSSFVPHSLGTFPGQLRMWTSHHRASHPPTMLNVSLSPSDTTCITQNLFTLSILNTLPTFSHRETNEPKMKLIDKTLT